MNFNFKGNESMKESILNDTRSMEHREHLKMHFCSARCISFSAIVMGAIAAISLSFLLNLLSLAIGFSAFPTTSDGQTAFAVSGFVGLVVCAILAMYPAGWIAGYLGRGLCMRKKMGELYGLGAWGLSLIVTIMLATYAGQFITQSTYLVNRNATLVNLTSAANKVVAEPTKKIEAAANMTPANPETGTTLGMVTFVSFFVFFIGFLAACFGGRMGMMHNRRALLARGGDYCEHCNHPH